MCAINASTLSCTCGASKPFSSHVADSFHKALFAAAPEIIFFDEPTTGLDPIMAGVINELIREIVVEMGATAMTITHDMTSVRAIADTVAMLHDGVIKWTGPVAEMDNSGDPYLDQFINGRAEGPIEAVR